MDPKDARKKVTPRTRAIIAVHLFGHPCDMRQFKELAFEHDLWLVEDAAEALGSFFGDKPVGSLSNIGCFSFHTLKTITSGEGGMCTTNDDDLDQTIRSLIDHGKNSDGEFVRLGYNFRMTNLQGAIGVAQLRKLPAIVRKKRLIESHYRILLRPVFEEKLATPQMRMRWAKCNPWLFSLVLGRGTNRDRIVGRLGEKGIACRSVFPPCYTFLHLRPHASSCGVAEWLGGSGMSLPSGPALTTKEIERVAEELETALRRQ
jgi:perosamine synthetase